MVHFQRRYVIVDECQMCLSVYLKRVVVAVVVEIVAESGHEKREYLERLEIVRQLGYAYQTIHLHTRINMIKSMNCVVWREKKTSDTNRHLPFV